MNLMMRDQEKIEEGKEGMLLLVESILSLHKEGLSDIEIADNLNVSLETINRILMKI